MRCLSCDCNLNDSESTRKSAVTGDYYDLCNGCFDTIKDQVIPLEIPTEEASDTNELDYEGLTED